MAHFFKFYIKIYWLGTNLFTFIIKVDGESWILSCKSIDSFWKVIQVSLWNKDKVNKTMEQTVLWK